jgi:hypothetical protein
MGGDDKPLADEEHMKTARDFEVWTAIRKRNQKGGTIMSRVVTIDNTSPDDNWITNRSDIPVTVACDEMFGSFTVNLRTGESKRITFDVRANAYPAGQYSYDNLKYKISKREKWEVRREGDELLMVKVGNVAEKRWWQFWK